MSENETPKSYRRPVIVASTVLALGGLSSLAINLVAISLAPSPEVGAYISGVFWPLALLASIELLIHTPWSKSMGDAWVKAGVLVIVAGVAAWISYWHGVHVLDHWGYDEVGKRVGPLVPDAAMALATLALHRVGQARRGAAAMTTPLATPTLANHAEAIVETLATGQRWTAEDMASVATVASGQSDGQPVATDAAEEDVVATEPATLASLEEDWATVEEDLDRELEEMTAAASAPEPEPATEPASAPEPEPEPVPEVKLTTVPALAAKRIQEALDAGASKTELSALDEALAEEGLAGSPRSARRWRAAVANGTARVS